MKPTPKHLRQRWRYLAIEIETYPDVSVGRDVFQRALWRACRSFAGDAGAAEADLTVFGYSFADGSGEAVIRTRRDSVSLARAAVGCLSEVDEHPIRLRVRGVSGTVRGCEEKYLGRDQERIGEINVTVDGVNRIGYRRGSDVDVRFENTFVGATMLDIE